MILILSQEKNEPTTESVIDWVYYFKSTVIRINDNDFNENIGLNFELPSESYSLEIKGFKFNLDSLKAVWYRKWNIRNSISKKKYSNNHIYENLEGELTEINAFFLNILKEKKILIGFFDANTTGKLSQLRKANELGLDIPNSMITNNICNVNIDSNLLNSPFRYFL